MAHRTALLAATVVLLVAGIACSSSSEDATLSDGDTAGTVGGMAGAGDDAAAGGVAGAGGDGAAGGAETADDATAPGVGLDVELAAVAGERRIVYRGELEAVVDDVAAATGAAQDAVGAEGGFLFGQEATGDWSRLVFKVPAPRFEAALDALARIGEVSSRFVEADDVTEQYVDLDSRRETLATSIGRLRGFLDDASTVEEISRLESELTRREADHDVIAGKLRVLDERTELATLSVAYVAEDEADDVIEAAGGPPGFGRGLSAGWDAVTVGAAALATGLGFALPFAPVAAVVAFLGLWWRHRLAGRPAPPVA